MRRFALPKRAFALAALGIAACTALDDPNDEFGSKDAASETGGVPARGGAPNDAGAVPSSGGVANVSGAANGGGVVQSGGSGGSGGSRSTPVSAGGSPDAGCFNPHGFQNVGCFVCAATDVVGLENSCSDAACTPFDNAARLSNLTALGQLPPLPMPPGAGGAGGSSGAGGSGGAAAGGAPSGGAAGKGGSTAAAGASGAGGGTSGRTTCDSLSSKGQVVYVTGSSAAKPFLQQIAQQIASQNAFVVYTSTGSCVGVDAIVNGTRMTTGPSPAPATSATYWDAPTSTGSDCDLPAGGVVADLGVSDVFAQSCKGFELTSLDALQIRDAHGAIQTMTFVVPQNSRFSEISAQAAYFVFGFGKDGGVLDGPSGSPIWNDETALHKRSAASGTQTMLGAAIGVPPDLWKGTPHATSDDVANAIKSAGQSKDAANLALGILAADYIDSQNLRADIRVLAFQDTSQRCAVFPDSTATSHDKQNVRDGHYPIWSPLHLLYKVDQIGNPLNPATRQIVLDIIGYLSGTKQLPNGVELIDVYAQSGLIPECAMHVSRTKDGGNIAPYQPESPCSCLFEAKATGSTTCKACRVQGDCGSTETCSQGYCEH
jgi:hypothetical protein